jgi:uncharacterized protein YuzE
MKIEYDKEVDALYIRLQEKYVTRTVELEEGLNLDLDESGKLIGLYVKEQEFNEIYEQADKTARIVSGLITYLRTKSTR